MTFPLHFCAAIRCQTEIDPGDLFCGKHLVMLDDGELVELKNAKPGSDKQLTLLAQVNCTLSKKEGLI